MDEANTASEGNLDIILCDRGIFDALCWFRWLKSRDKMSEEEYDVLTQFAMLNRWQKNIDLVYIFLTTPEESIRREYVYVDGIYLRRNWGGEFENVAILVAIAVNEDGYQIGRAHV